MRGTFEPKGFDLSIDYELLWKLINNGYRIPAWLIYEERPGYIIYDLVEVKKISDQKGYLIGSRGIGYDGTDEEFIPICKKYKLRFIVPNKIIPS